MALNFINTCPIIDSNITDFKFDIELLLNEMIDDNYLPLNNKKKGFIIRYTKEIYDIFENRFEGVRGTNQDMRHVADNQLDELGEKLDELEDEKTKLENQIDKLKEKVDVLETENTKLETEKTELENQIEKLEYEIEK